MATVPIYGTSQVAPSGLPNVQIQGLSPRELANAEIPGEQAERLGQNAVNFASEEMDGAAKIQMMANQVRVDAALNQVRAAQQQLTYDPTNGYLSQKGAAAIQPNDQGQGLQDVYGQKLQDAISSASGDLANDAQRQVFARSAAQLSTQFNGQVQSHVLQEYKTFGLNTQQGTVDLAHDAAMKSWNDPDAVQQQVDSAKAAAWKAGQINGDPANLVQAKMQAVTSSIHSGVINEALVNNNPLYAQQYLQKYKDDMTAGDILKVQGMITSDIRARTATSAAQNAMSTYQSAFAPTPLDRMAQITAQTESGNKDMKGDGSPVTSSAGAKYGMQVMPVTAANPGHGIAPAANDSPAEYNRVGQQLLGALVQKYGDPAKAWAAYNAGEGNVDKAIADAGPGGNWMDALAKYQSADNHTQTVNYVNTNMAALNKGSGAAPLPSLQDIHNNIRAQVGNTADPHLLTAALAEGTRQYTDAMKDRQTQADNAITQAQQFLVQNGGDMGALQSKMPDVYSQIVNIAPDKLPALQTYAKNIANPPKVDNMAQYLYDSQHPEKLAALSDADFNVHVMSNYDPSTQKYFQKIRDAQINGKSDTGPSTLNEQVFKTEMNNRMQSIGLMGSNGKAADANQAGSLLNYMRKEALDFQQQTGQKMTESQLINFIDNQFLKNVNVPGMLWGSDSKPMYGMRAGDIPSGDKAQIQAKFAKAGVPNPTPDQMLQAYWASKNRPSAPQPQDLPTATPPIKAPNSVIGAESAAAAPAAPATPPLTASAAPAAPVQNYQDAMADSDRRLAAARATNPYFNTDAQRREAENAAQADLQKRAADAAKLASTKDAINDFLSKAKKQ